MRVHIATDHAAFELKNYLVERLREDGHDVVDHGAHTYEALDDYPPLIIPCAEAVAAEPGSLGIVLGGSGNGEQMAANKVKGIRAALANNVELARLTREHNDANIICIGERLTGPQVALDTLDAFVAAEFQAGRHTARVAKLDALLPRP